MRSVLPCQSAISSLRTTNSSMTACSHWSPKWSEVDDAGEISGGALELSSDAVECWCLVLINKPGILLAWCLTAKRYSSALCGSPPAASRAITSSGSDKFDVTGSLGPLKYSLSSEDLARFMLASFKL